MPPDAPSSPPSPEALPQLLPIATTPESQDRYTHLMQRILTRKDELLQALSSMDFYIELAFIIGAILFAKLVAISIRRRVKTLLQKKPIRSVDPEFILKPLTLLTSLFSLLFFTIEKVTFEVLDISSGMLDAAIQLGFAYTLARCVLLMVRTRFVARFIAFVIMVVATLRAMRFMKSTSAYLDSLAFDLGHFHVSVLGVLNGIVVLVVVFWIASALSQTLESILHRSTTITYNARELAVKCFKIIVYFVAFIITLNAMGVDLTAFAVFGGALGVGVGLGLQKLTGNFVSSVTLLMEKSIKMGDLVEVAGFTGWIRKLNTRYALLETFDGREVMIPNEVMVSTNLTNWTHTSTHARVEIKVMVDYDSDPVKACDLILQAAREHPECMKKPEPTCVLKEFADNGLVFILNFWIVDIKEGRAGPQSQVMFAILKKFKEAGIHMPRPQTVIQMTGESLAKA